MLRNIILVLVLSITILGCHKEPLVVPEPQLIVTPTSSKVLKYGELFTISWKAINASTIRTNFCPQKDITGSYSENLYESKTFVVEAFNSEGISVMKKVSVVVEPYHTAKEIILLSHKWVLSAVTRDYGPPTGWVPYDIIADLQFLFDPDYSYKVYDSGGNIVGSGKDYYWSLSELENETVLDVGSRKFKVITLSEEKMEIFYSSDGYTYIDTYKAEPVDEFMKD